MTYKRDPMARVNTRIEHYQNDYVKAMVKADPDVKSEGEVFRKIIQYYIDKHK